MKFKVTRTDGTDNSGKKYLVVNIDEPYAGQVADLIEAEERRKGTWEHGNKSLREVMEIPSEESVCFKHSKKHDVIWSEVQKTNCEDLPCFKDCALIEHI